MEKFNYYALHFHMKQAGVRIVIENIMESFKQNSKNKFAIIESGNQKNYKAPNGVKHIKISELDYSNKRFKSKKQFYDKAKKIAKQIEKKIDFKKHCVIHAHNANLFKNPTLAAALKIIAEKNPTKVTVLMQAHDFAEDNRKKLLNLMLTCTGKKDKSLAGDLAFPQAKNIFYLTINSRDKRLLKMINIPDEKIFVFPNAINIHALEQKPVKDKKLLELIDGYAKKEGYNFSTKRKIILYPVKVIQRKNIVEAILLLKLINSIKNEYQLLITLDANSKEDIQYSTKIKQFVKNKKLPVTIGFGYSVISSTNKRETKNGKISKYIMADLFEKAQCILTTSTLEGFGFAFLEGWITGKEVIGRKIDFVVEDFEKNGINFPGVYNKIEIDKNDFGKMKLNKQLETIDKLKTKRIIQQNNLDHILNEIMNPNTIAINKNKKAIKKNYSLKKYYLRLEKIVKTTQKLKDKNFPTLNINNQLLIDYFSKEIETQIIITDLDGTLLDHNNYSHLVSLPTYNKAQDKKTPICFCTSKSFDEQIHLRKILKNKDPFIAENGSAIYIPKKYFSFKITKKLLKNFTIKNIKKIDDYNIIELNVSHKETYATLKTIQKNLPFKINIFTDHSVRELQKIAKLPKKYAELSKIKYYADGCRIPNMNPKKLNAFKKEAKKLGFETKVGGRFVGINKGSDKGVATKILLELFRKKYKRIYSIGLGDSQNDFPMLKEVDKPFLVKCIGKNITKEAKKEVEGINIVNKIGPKGWVFIIEKFL